MKKERSQAGFFVLPFAAAVVILGLATSFASGALPLDTSKPVDWSKLGHGQAEYKVNP